MAEGEGIRVRDLDELEFFKAGLEIVVSDKTIPEDSQEKRSFRLDPMKIRQKEHLWTPPALFNTVQNAIPGDILVVHNLPNPVVFGNRVIKNNDRLQIVSINENFFMFLSHDAVEKPYIAVINAGMSPYTARANSVLYLDVSSGPVTIVLPAVVTNGDFVELVPMAGLYSVNPVTLQSTKAIAGVEYDEDEPTDNQVVIDIDDLRVEARFANEDYGYALTS